SKFKMVKDFTDNKMQFVDGGRNSYVHQFTCNGNRAGFMLEETLSHVLSEFGYNRTEVINTVKSAYSNTSEFGIDSHRYSKVNSTYQSVANVSDVASVAQQTSSTG